MTSAERERARKKARNAYYLKKYGVPRPGNAAERKLLGQMARAGASNAASLQRRQAVKRHLQYMKRDMAKNPGRARRDVYIPGPTRKRFRAEAAQRGGMRRVKADDEALRDSLRKMRQLLTAQRRRAVPTYSKRDMWAPAGRRSQGPARAMPRNYAVFPKLPVAKAMKPSGSGRAGRAKQAIPLGLPMANAKPLPTGYATPMRPGFAYGSRLPLAYAKAMQPALAAPVPLVQAKRMGGRKRKPLAAGAKLSSPTRKATRPSNASPPRKVARRNSKNTSVRISNPTPGGPRTVEVPTDIIERLKNSPVGTTFTLPVSINSRTGAMNVKNGSMPIVQKVVTKRPQRKAAGKRRSPPARMSPPSKRPTRASAKKRVPMSPPRRQPTRLAKRRAPMRMM